MGFEFGEEAQIELTIVGGYGTGQPKK
jgi:hypothetical protein